MTIETQYDLTDYLLKRANLQRLGHAGYTLVMLSTYVGKGWRCWPSMKVLSGRTGASQKTIQRHIDYLCDIGWITKTKSTGDDSEHVHNIYTFNIDTIKGESEL